ncbi:hypothetical protein JN06_00283 [Bacteroides zoogleoformans]|uniref:Alpha/beta fold hydrolase n=1 Tax=Bacteroides zoogleoformans TaxID=28119 RepID=A0ABM6TAF4_9BACE|nr:alpha/beta fold hydrolase [Bacteroides zoogleoformans]AVM53721.1 hypothetical protein C4H11_13120 [Bacteroides zoogleoformans]TWJ18130.1 hypothetical protein JN06_00283 [Bacteroides zoogleoformans]
MSAFGFLRWVLIGIGFLSGYVCVVHAQNSHIVRAQRIYELFAAGQGDSVHAALNKELQAKLSPADFNDTFRQTEKTFGPLQSKGDWQTDAIQGAAVYYRDLMFERYSLRFILAFDANGGMNTIRLAPVPALSSAKPVSYDAAKMTEREITVGADGFELPGTLTLPVFASKQRKVPCVVLIHGSGPNDRDETIGPNKPFRDLARGLAERGIAVIRYDKRTKVYGANSVPAGRALDYDTETVDDALSALRRAEGLPEIATDSIFVSGHSLGGMLAPRIAQKSDIPAGIVILSGPARPLDVSLKEQLAYIASLTGTKVDVQEQADKLMAAQPRSYWDFAETYRPVETAAGLTLPILVLQGERDYQVTMEDFALWRSGLLHRKNAFFKSYPRLNHLMQEGSGKATPFEYNRASPVAAYVMDDIASFVRGERGNF